MESSEKEPIKSGVENEGPGTLFLLYLQCEQVVEKLKLLNYDEDYIKISSACRPISRHYFVTSTNTGEQFFLFTTLCGWIIQKFLNTNFVIAGELDDPNTVIANILQELKAKGITIDFITSRLKSGSGQHCIYVLDKLTDLALTQSDFQWQKTELEPPNEDDDDTYGIDSGNAISQQSDSEDDIAVAEDIDEGTIIDLRSSALTEPNFFDKNSVLDAVLESDTNAENWKLEVNRLAPQLKVYIKQDAKDWKMHLEQMHSACNAVQEILNVVKPQFDNISSNLSKELERISTREKHLNNQLAPLLEQYRSVQNELTETQQKYRDASGGIVERNNTLQQITDEINQIKWDIEEQGQKNSDAAPIVRIKQAIAKMEDDIKVFDVQIGVVEYSLIQAKVKQRNWHIARPVEMNF